MITPLETRFWSRVVIRETGCLEWTGWINSVSGYGHVYIGGGNANRKIKYAHRVSYEIANGPIPEGLEIDHLCRNKRCCSPAHLEAVTPAVNNARSTSISVINGAKTHCTHGHELSGENVRLRVYKKSGALHRSCRTCERALRRKRTLAEASQRDALSILAATVRSTAAVAS